jgi:CRP-like cAMP-binding protein
MTLSRILTTTETPVPPLPNVPKVRRFERRAHLPFKPNELWQIQSGIVRTLTWHEDGTIITLGLWGTGDIVSRLLSPADPYQIECLTAVEVIRIPITNHAQVNAALIEHIHKLQELLEILHSRPVDVSLVRFLSWLAKKFGREVEKGQLIDMRLTHQEIADILGTTRVTVTRTLNEFERQGIIERFSRQSMLLIDDSTTWYYEI